jgi:hypothetical protein
VEKKKDREEGVEGLRFHVRIIGLGSEPCRVPPPGELG